MIPPHGGKLISRILTRNDREKTLRLIPSIKRVDLSQELAFEVENIATGLFSPLQGFLGREDFQSVLKEGRLKSGIPWTIPIVLDIDADLASEIGDHLALYYKGEPIAIMTVEEIYDYDRAEMAKSVYGTLNERHPGVVKVKDMKERLVGGKIDLINPIPARFSKHHLTPEETRALFKSKGWKTVVAFQTRNVPHIGHEYLQKSALTFVDGLFINPVIGKKKKGDYKDEVIIDAYLSLIKNYYPEDKVVLNTLQMEMRYAEIGRA
ncbi:MAG TPA: sulfate adenylyltransferase, partial [bacterium (Candidatus Stahlbacteria)]|nr:sulfate adenylyltransferase [Candidatus Stahlbacteria bacterium]